MLRPPAKALQKQGFYPEALFLYLDKIHKIAIILCITNCQRRQKVNQILVPYQVVELKTGQVVYCMTRRHEAPKHAFYFAEADGSLSEPYMVRQSAIEDADTARWNWSKA